MISKRIRYSVLGLLVVAVAVAGYVWARPLIFFATASGPEDRCPGHERFDSAVWRDTVAAYSELAPRACMIDDLLQQQRLVGMDRDAVIGLLGEPARTGYFKEFDLVYWLGPERGLFSIDSEWLVMRLDANGRVTEARLVTD